MVEKRGLASQVEFAKDGDLVSRALNQRHIYLEKRSAYRSYNGTTLVTGRTKSNSKTGYHQDPSLGQLPVGHVRASAPQHQLGSIITSKETHQTLSNRPIVRNSFVKKDPYQRISLNLNGRVRESAGRLLRPMTAPFHQSLNKLKKNQRSVQYLRNPFAMKQSNHFVYPSEWLEEEQGSQGKQDGQDQDLVVGASSAAPSNMKVPDQSSGQ